MASLVDWMRSLSRRMEEEGGEEKEGCAMAVRCGCHREAQDVAREQSGHQDEGVAQRSSN